MATPQLVVAHLLPCGRLGEVASAELDAVALLALRPGLTKTTSGNSALGGSASEGKSTLA